MDLSDFGPSWVEGGCVCVSVLTELLFLSTWKMMNIYPCVNKLSKKFLRPKDKWVKILRDKSLLKKKPLITRFLEGGGNDELQLKSRFYLVWHSSVLLIDTIIFLLWLLDSRPSRLRKMLTIFSMSDGRSILNCYKRPLIQGKTFVRFPRDPNRVSSTLPLRFLFLCPFFSTSGSKDFLQVPSVIRDVSRRIRLQVSILYQPLEAPRRIPKTS